MTIDAIFAELETLESKLLWIDAERLLKTAIEAYPESEELKERLISVMFQLIRRNRPDYYREKLALEIGEALVKSSDNYEIINSVNRNLCFIEALHGNTEEAKKYYDRLPSLDATRELYAAYVMDGNELKAQLQRNIENYIIAAATTAKQLAFRESGEKACRLLEKTIDLYELLYEGDECGPYLSDMAVCALDIASIKAKCGDIEGSLSSLERAVDLAERYNTSEDSGKRSSVFVDRIQRRANYGGTNIAEIIKDAVNTSDNFADVRRDERLKPILAKLS
ncbi:MAG: hypothetical protein ACOX4O_11760 [Eubacteriales bacterium]|jgi:hypothetical protein